MRSNPTNSPKQFPAFMNKFFELTMKLKLLVQVFDPFKTNVKFVDNFEQFLKFVYDDLFYAHIGDKVELIKDYDALSDSNLPHFIKMSGVAKIGEIGYVINIDFVKNKLVYVVNVYLESNENVKFPMQLFLTKDYFIVKNVISNDDLNEKKDDD